MLCHILIYCLLLNCCVGSGPEVGVNYLLGYRPQSVHTIRGMTLSTFGTPGDWQFDEFQGL